MIMKGLKQRLINLSTRHQDNLRSSKDTEVNLLTKNTKNLKCINSDLE